jgi:hypothetical protein
VKVTTYYMLGNHDWCYHLRGPGFDTIRQRNAAFSLANPAAPCPHDPSEYAALERVSEHHRVWAARRYHDPFSYSRKGRDQLRWAARW